MMNVADSGVLSLESAAHETLMLGVADTNELGTIEFLKPTLFFSHGLASINAIDEQHAAKCKEQGRAHEV
jgi:hypothetical protein